MITFLSATLKIRSKGKSLCRAVLHALSAADAVCVVAFLYRIEAHGTCLLTGSAIYTSILVKLYTDQGYPVEEPVYGTERTDKTAERSEDECGTDDDPGKDKKLDDKHQPRLISQGSARTEQKQSADRSLRAYELTKSGISHSFLYVCNNGKQDDQHDQHCVLEPSQNLKSLHALRNGDLMDQLLEQSEGTEPSAHKSSEYRCEKKDSTYYVGIYSFFQIAESLLKGT